MRVGVWYREHLLIKQSIHFWWGLVYGREDTCWSNRAYTSDEVGLWMDGWVRVLRPFNSISVISRRWKGEHERLCAMKRRLGSGRISPPAGFEPATPWSEVGSANRSATRTLRLVYGTEDTYWSNIAYTSDEGWCMVQRTLTDQIEHSLLMRVGVW